MKRLLYILMIFSIYMLLTGKSCENERTDTEWQEKQVMLARDSIIDEFDADYLSEDARYAAEAKAIQDLNDFADYVEIFSDRSKDTLFRAKAEEMIGNLFHSPENIVYVGLDNNRKNIWINVDNFLYLGYDEDIQSVKLDFDSITVKKPLTRLNKNTYAGVLSAYQELTYFTSKDSTKLNRVPLDIKFSSIKTDKVFGKDTLQTWEVRLGDMGE